METVCQVFDIDVPELGPVPAAPVPCLLCGRRDAVPLNTFCLNGTRFHTVRCPHDGMMWLDPQPAAAFYDTLYSRLYHNPGLHEALLEQVTLDVHGNADDRRRVAALRLDQIEGFAAPGRLLEVGFGGGAVLIEAAARGWQAVGLELDPGCVAAMNALGIPACRGELPTFEAPAASFDVVAMYSLIEHTLDPLAYLARARELLRPGGVLALRLPDTEPEGPPASLIAHVYHFDSHTITLLLRRAGFAVQQIDSFTLWRPTRYPGALWNMNVISRRT
jgi:SAM-dependent methyltransferase